jgi:hypothetical protein
LKIYNKIKSWQKQKKNNRWGIIRRRKKIRILFPKFLLKNKKFKISSFPDGSGSVENYSPTFAYVTANDLVHDVEDSLLDDEPPYAIPRDLLEIYPLLGKY